MEKVILQLGRNDVIGETLAAHIANFFNTDASADWFSKKGRISSSFMSLIPTFVQCKTYFRIADQNTVIAKASSKEPKEATETYGDVMEKRPIRLDWPNEELYCSRSSRRRSKIRHVK